MKPVDDRKPMFLQVFTAKNLHIGKTCKAVGISRQTYYNWCTDDPAFAEEVKALEEFEIDDAEEFHKYLRTGIPKTEVVDGKVTMVGWIKEPDRIALEKYLTTKGRHRGWGDALQVTGSGANGEIVIVKIPDNGRG